MIKGLDEVQRNLKREVEKLERATLAGLIAGGEVLRAESQKLVPVVTGNLKGSAHVTWKGGGGQPSGPVQDQGGHDSAVSEARGVIGDKLAVIVGYSAVYAAATHENPRAGKTGGVSPSGRRYSPGRLPSGRKSTRKVWSTVGQWKFLETALKQHSKRILDVIAKYSRKALHERS